MGHVLGRLRRCADFAGRARRGEFWRWTLALLAVEAVLWLWLLAAAYRSGSRFTAAVAIPYFAAIALMPAAIVPALAVTVRRLHDVGRSAWMLALMALPPLGAIVLIALMCRPGTSGPNRYGPDPRTDGPSSVAGGSLAG